MFRFVFGLALTGLLAAGSALIAQNTAPPQPTRQEPPVASEGEVKQAPDSVVVEPGRPRLLPNMESSSFEPKTSEPGEASNQVEAVQYVGPAPAKSPAPTVLYPEPPTPVVRISVKGPEIAPTNQELTYKMTVSNTPDARAHNVIARFTLPRGTKLVKALPEPKADGKELEWHLETLETGATRSIEIVIKPDVDVTELAAVGRVQFEHGRVVKTRLAQPTLEMKKIAPPQAILHDPVTFRIVIKNPGKVAVTDTQIVDSLPEGLEYVQETSNGAIPVSKVGPEPNQRTWTIGTIRAGDSRTLEYRVMPRKIGDWTSEVIANATGVSVKAGSNTFVQEAKVALQINGPINDKATANQAAPYLILVHNTGTAVLNNVRVSFTFPLEMRVAKASKGGHLFRDAVQWMVPKMEPNETKELSVSLVAPSGGLREIVVSARADRGLEQRKRITTVYEGIPALNWHAEGTPTAAPGQEITYVITVKNPGSAPAKNVKIVADLPEQVEFRLAQPAFQRGQGAVYFNPLEIAPKDTKTFKIVVVAKKAGEARFQFEMSAEGLGLGPLKHMRATSISPGAEPKKEDANPTPDPAKPPKKLDPAGLRIAQPDRSTSVVPAGNQAPAVPASDWKDLPKTGEPAPALPGIVAPPLVNPSPVAPGGKSEPKTAEVIITPGAPLPKNPASPVAPDAKREPKTAEPTAPEIIIPPDAPLPKNPS